MEERSFSLDDQIAFARLSGDYNKLHVDAIAARRYQFGEPVVHGIHMALWALDTWIEKNRNPIELVSLKVSFKKPLPLGEIVRCRIYCERNNQVNLELCGQEEIYAHIKLVWQSAAARDEDGVNPIFPECRACRVLPPEEIADARGELDLCIEKETAAKLFPNLLPHVPILQLAQLLATTRLVGMECPGFYSLFYELDVVFQSSKSGSLFLQYNVTQFDSKFHLVVMAIDGPTMKGNIRALIRPGPRMQKSFAEIRTIVVPGEFRDQCALIIGGSRGLGEVTSKLLAAGGASVVLTYRKGHDEAQQLANEIISGGGTAGIMHFNVLAPQGTQMVKTGGPPANYLYYFATPHITARRGTFSKKLFMTFCDYYVSGFVETMGIILKYNPNIKKAFYPSSVFVEELPLSLGEYAAAKAAGETLCAYLEKAHRGILIYRPRLPKMATDQTISMMGDDCNDPLPIMLQQLRKFKNYGG